MMSSPLVLIKKQLHVSIVRLINLKDVTRICHNVCDVIACEAN